MKKILFFETTEYTGATRVTHTLAKIVKNKCNVAFAQVGDNTTEDIESAIDIEKPDILFSSFIKINPEVIKVGKQRELYVVVRNDYKLSDVPIKVKSLVLKYYPLADEIIVQTEEMRQEFLSQERGDTYKVKVMENPLDEEYILHQAAEPTPFPNDGKFHFLWVGRKDPIKDLSTLQRAFEIVHEQYPDTEMTLLSDDPNPYRWMKNADCLVISSRSEASPNVLREAIFLKTKVISTDCSETIRQLLQPQNIVPIHNPEALAEVMAKTVQDKERLLL